MLDEGGPSSRTRRKRCSRAARGRAALMLRRTTARGGELRRNSVAATKARRLLVDVSGTMEAITQVGRPAMELDAPAPPGPDRATRERWRDERIADNEGTGRRVNEHIVEVGPAPRANKDSARTFRCECGNEVCAEPLRIPLAVYERVRADSMLFIVRPGHVFPEAETVVETATDYQIVKKDEDLRRIAEKTDPRS